MTQKLKYALLGFLVAALGLWGLAVTIPNSFSSGEVVSAAKMNENFQALKTAVDTLEAKVAALEDKLSAVGPGQKALASKDGAMARALVRWNGTSVSVDNLWSFNSSGSGITATRTGPGEYQVDFLDLAAANTPYGTAVASTRDNTGVRCEAWSVTNEGNTAPDVRVLVECRNPSGALTDTSFRVLYVR
ncbi:hypothetical protein Ocepr_2181 [Oceanithermus profundus DSM 14977]|uniref:Uncharacterized protein n=1 Tax=Oceanithermus profundus (strain DSM 14977 / NBRC 100410 / VKM B-2274 / 506) TaxID=670487 RepID=E4UAC5_OCEP5|nr:hypothetical protein [Oceanithermus profundus]ADR37630.1 hypothetical protein Ocepr_2181 [Oceanithermus profundus DSM 14977]